MPRARKHAIRKPACHVTGQPLTRTVDSASLILIVAPRYRQPNKRVYHFATIGCSPLFGAVARRTMNQDLILQKALREKHAYRSRNP